MVDTNKYFSDKKFLKVGDVRDGGKFEIERFEEITMNGKVKPVLHFIGVEGTFSLNKVNLETMIRKFGKNEEKWRGKKITLVIGQAPNPQKGGQIGPAMRIA